MAQTSTELPSVLAVDDEPSVLSALTRLLARSGMRVLTATSGSAALQILEEHASSISVLISDYAMPGMNGAELMHSVLLRWPDITRVLLTGNADMASAARAVNEGQLSRLLTKPWQPDNLRQTVVEALEQHQLLIENRRLRQLADEQAERLEHMHERLERLVVERTTELEAANAQLHRSLLEIVRLLVISLEHRLPVRAARCREVARLAGALAERAGMGPVEARRVQVAALVHDVGLTALPDTVVRRPPGELAMSARTQYQTHPVIGQRMLRSVAELTDIGSWIRHHHERWDGGGYPDKLAGEAIPLASRIIGLADDYLAAVGSDTMTVRQWRETQKTAGAFDPALLELLAEEESGRALNKTAHSPPTAPAPAERAPLGPGVYEEAESIAVAIESLRTGMVLVDEVVTTSGTVLLSAGEQLTAERLQHIQEFQREGGLRTTRVGVAVGTLVTESAPPIA